MARSHGWLLLARVDSASGGEQHEITTNGEILGCDCTSWRFARAPKRCKHTDEILPLVTALGGPHMAYQLLSSGITVDASTTPERQPRRRPAPHSAPPLTLADSIERLLESVAAQQAMPDESWRREWATLRARVVHVVHHSNRAPREEPKTTAVPDWLGGSRAIILRD